MAKKEIIEVGFLIPVFRDKIFLGQRNTEPYKSKFSAIGGKQENFSLDNGFFSFLFREDEDLGDMNFLNKIDKSFFNGKKEAILTTTIREFCEEIFTEKIFPSDFNLSQFINIVDLGSVYDKFNGKEFICSFFLAKVDIDLSSISLSSRELMCLKPLAQIRESEIVPMTKFALIQLKYLMLSYNLGHNISGTNLEYYKSIDINGQIPYFIELPQILEKDVTVFPNMIGVTAYYSTLINDKQLWPVNLTEVKRAFKRQNHFDKKTFRTFRLGPLVSRFKPKELKKLLGY